MADTTFKPSKIYPMGMFLETEVIQAFLKIAVKNDLITQEQYDSIDGFEVMIGDRTLHKSIIAKGIGYDMYMYEDNQGRPIYYSNYPYNDLGKDQLHYKRWDMDMERPVGKDGSVDESKLIKHPYDSGGRGTGNDRYTFHSPDVHIRRPNLPNELVVEGYQVGGSRGAFAQVKDHSTWVILTDAANDAARLLAVGEAIMDAVGKVGDFVMDLAELTPSISTPVGMGQGIGAWGGMANGTLTQNWVGLPVTTSKTGSVAAIISLSILLGLSGSSVSSTYSKAKAEWLKIFKDFGDPVNFAYYYSSVGFYNKGVRNTTQDSYLRGLSAKTYLSDGRVRVTEESVTEAITINHTDRESCAFLSTHSSEDDFKINYPEEIRYIDDSRVKAGDAGINYEGNNDREVDRRIASPYFSLKQYNPSQYSTINSIKWLPTGYCGKLDANHKFHRIFGGDTFISRIAIKRKIPFFLSTAFGLPPRTPFKYQLYDNIGANVYYGDYDISNIEKLPESGFPTGLLDLIGLSINAPSPNQHSVFFFDTYKDKGNYVREYSKFYLWYYGIPSFLCESEINSNYRYAGREPQQNFYPNVGDYMQWTQENFVSIRRDNEFRYNNIYSKLPTLSNATLLPDSYNKKEFDCRFDMPNGVIYSMQDLSEQGLTDPWAINRPLDYYQFPSSYGRLIRLKGIESNQVIGVFENQLVLYNAIDTIKERVSPETSELGTGGIFESRPIEYSKSDMGYAGSQHSTLLSTPYGHMYADAKRGVVVKLTNNATAMDIITKGKARWFKRHLPFKILNQGIRNLSDLDLDNSYNHLGLSLGWDNMNDRLLLTKLDYIVKKGNAELAGRYISFNQGHFYLCQEIDRQEQIIRELSILDTNFFKPVPFTMSYTPAQDRWTTYHSYLPNYYISTIKTLRSGYNMGNTNGDNSDYNLRSSLWSHGLTNQSFCVFQGRLYPFEVEFITENSFQNDKASSVEYWMDARRYKDEVNYSALTNVGFDKVFIYNDTENTGLLDIIPAKSNNLFQRTQYPKFLGERTQVLADVRMKNWNINHLYNRIKKDNTNVQQLVRDENSIYVLPNAEVLDNSLRIKDRLRGNWFRARFSVTNSPYKFIVQWFHTTIQS